MKKLFLVLIILTFSVLNLFAQQGQVRASQDILFESPDLVVTYQPVPDSSVYTLYGYAGINNKSVLTQPQKNSAELRWFSPGLLRFIRKQDKIYDVQGSTFGLFIESLNTLQREALAKQATAQCRDKVGGEIRVEQIHLMPLEFFNGIIRIKDENGKERIFRGETVAPVKQSPFRLEFEVKNSADLQLLEKAVSQGTAVLCEWGFAGVQEKTNHLTLTLQQLVDLGIINDIFGHGEKAYVSRKQCGSLAAKIYDDLNVVEEYEIDEEKFSEDFVRDLIVKIMPGGFVPMDFMEVLKYLSNFMLPSLKKDLQPDKVVSDIGRVFTIQKKGDKEFLKINQEMLNKGKNWSDLKASANASVDILDIFSGDASFNYVSSKSEEWEKNNKDFKEQLSELNTHAQKEIQWEKSGETIIPKTVNVVIFNKAQFQRILTFHRIRTVKKGQGIRDNIKLNTVQDVGLTSIPDRETQLVKEMAVIKDSFTTLLQKLDISLAQVNQSLAQVNQNLTSVNDNVKLVHTNTSNINVNALTLKSDLTAINETIKLVHTNTSNTNVSVCAVRNDLSAISNQISATHTIMSKGWTLFNVWKKMCRNCGRGGRPGFFLGISSEEKRCPNCIQVMENVEIIEQHLIPIK